MKMFQIGRFVIFNTHSNIKADVSFTFLDLYDFSIGISQLKAMRSLVNVLRSIVDRRAKLIFTFHYVGNFTGAKTIKNVFFF